VFPKSWSQDGRFLLYTQIGPGTGADVFALQVQEHGSELAGGRALILTLRRVSPGFILEEQEVFLWLKPHPLCSRWVLRRRFLH
jgi:hypothetical protein